MATPRSFSNYKASSDNRRSRTAFKADLIVALGPKPEVTSYSITSSATNCIEFGMLRLNAFAVFKFTTSLSAMAALLANRRALCLSGPSQP
jgi:hypothetical protein